MPPQFIQVEDPYQQYIDVDNPTKHKWLYSYTIGIGEKCHPYDNSRGVLHTVAQSKCAGDKQCQARFRQMAMKTTFTMVCRWS